MRSTDLLCSWTVLSDCHEFIDHAAVKDDSVVDNDSGQREQTQNHHETKVGLHRVEANRSADKNEWHGQQNTRVVPGGKCGVQLVDQRLERRDHILRGDLRITRFDSDCSRQVFPRASGQFGDELAPLLLSRLPAVISGSWLPTRLPELIRNRLADTPRAAQHVLTELILTLTGYTSTTLWWTAFTALGLGALLSGFIMVRHHALGVHKQLGTAGSECTE